MRENWIGKMGRFKAEAIIIRKLPEVEVIFYDWKSIYVYDHHGNGAVFHRWFAPRGSYGDYWQDFRRKMLRVKHLNLVKCYELAAAHDVQSIYTNRRVDLTDRKVVCRE